MTEDTWPTSPSGASRSAPLPRRPGVWTMTGHPVIVEALARSGAAFLGIDFQHGFLGFDEVARAIQIATLCNVPTYVRLSREHVAWIPRVLDAGADGIIAAMVTGVDDVHRIVAATRYQPLGTRSYGGWRYGLRLEPPDPRQIPVQVYVMVETPEAVESVDAIAATPHLSGIYLGPVDLALALSSAYPAQWGDVGWERAARKTLNACHRFGLSAGTFAVHGLEAGRLFHEGFTDVVISSDVALLRLALEEHLRLALNENTSTPCHDRDEERKKLP